MAGQAGRVNGVGRQMDVVDPRGPDEFKLESLTIRLYISTHWKY